MSPVQSFDYYISDDLNSFQNVGCLVYRINIFSTFDRRVQSKRPRVARDKSGQGKIGRPRKADPKVEPEPAQADVHPEPTSVEELPPLQAASLPEPTYQEPPTPLTFSLMPLSFAPVLIQPEVEIVPVLSEVEKLDTEPKTGQLVEEMLIEDLGPDEQEDIPQPKELLLPDLGRCNTGCCLSSVNHCEPGQGRLTRVRLCRHK